VGKGELSRTPNGERKEKGEVKKYKKRVGAKAKIG